MGEGEAGCACALGFVGGLGRLLWKLGEVVDGLNVGLGGEICSLTRRPFVTIISEFTCLAPVQLESTLEGLAMRSVRGTGYYKECIRISGRSWTRSMGLREAGHDFQCYSQVAMVFGRI